MVQQTAARTQFEGDAYKSEDEIPYSLSDALDLFEDSADLHEVLGEDFSRVYSIVKRTENEEFLQVISPWEREHLLLNV
jgi:glutamine synthetase